MSDTKTFLVSILTDSDGFVGRSCDAPECGQYFKVHVSDHKETLFCPYCGKSFSRSSLLTREQTDHIRRVGMEEARVYAVQELQKTFRQAFSGSKFVTYKPGPTPRKQPVFPRYSERRVDTELECTECKTRFQVYGIFGFCPGCQCENLRIYDANWAIIKRQLEVADDIARQLRHAYSDLVSTFEVFCKRKANRISAEVDNFQILFNARKFFTQHADVDILANVAPRALLSLRRVFQKRHVCIHAGGEITEQYVRMIPEDRVLLGTQAELSIPELEEAATAMRIALGDMVKKLERPGR